MAEKQLTNEQANALSGTTEAATGVRYPSADADPWLAPRNRLDEQLARIAEATNQLRVFEVEGNPDAIGVRPGNCIIDGEHLSFEGADPALDGLSDNTAHLIYAQDEGGQVVIVSATDAQGWPGTPHIRLARVTLAEGTITDLTDLRALLRS